MIGAKQVIFVATNQPGVFAQREVRAGQESNGVVPIYTGLDAGERVVTDGSFLLRAESLKLDSSQLTASQNRPAATAESLTQQAQGDQSKAKSSQLSDWGWRLKWKSVQGNHMDAVTNVHSANHVRFINKEAT
jgi:hypothetical protein